MKIKVPQPDTEMSLFMTAISVLRITGADKVADDLDQRMEDLLSSRQTPRIAAYVSGGILQAVRSNIGANLEVELVDQDNEPEAAEDRWTEINDELVFGNY